MKILSDTDLIEWLRQNGSGIYRPSVQAADRMQELIIALYKIAAIEDMNDCGDWEEIEEARTIARDTLYHKTKAQ